LFKAQRISKIAPGPFLAQTLPKPQKDIVLMISDAQLIDIVLLCSRVLWFSKLTKN